MPQGDKLIQDIVPGDRIRCADGKTRAVLWVGRKYFDAADLAQRPRLRPVRIGKGALGDGLPNRDLLVSPQHRILVSGWQTELWFGESEMLVAAKHLVNGGSITIDHGADSVCYFHLLFEDHQIVYSNGAKSESFYPGVETLRGLGRETRRELLEIFPELRDGPQVYGAIACPVITASEASVLRL